MCVAPVLTPDSHLWFAKCSPTLSPPGHCCALCDCIVYVSVLVCVCVWDEVLSNRWSNLIHVSFLPRCPLALMVRWWCYLGLTSILSALFLEASLSCPTLLCSALLCSASPPPFHNPGAAGLGHTLVPQEQLAGGAALRLPGTGGSVGVRCVWKNNILFTVNEQMLLLL